MEPKAWLGKGAVEQIRPPLEAMSVNRRMRHQGGGFGFAADTITGYLRAFRKDRESGLVVMLPFGVRNPDHEFPNYAAINENFPFPCASLLTADEPSIRPRPRRDL